MHTSVSSAAFLLTDAALIATCLCSVQETIVRCEKEEYKLLRVEFLLCARVYIFYTTSISQDTCAHVYNTIVVRT